MGVLLEVIVLNETTSRLLLCNKFGIDLIPMASLSSIRSNRIRLDLI